MNKKSEREKDRMEEGIYNIVGKEVEQKGERIKNRVLLTNKNANSVLKLEESFQSYHH